MMWQHVATKSIRWLDPKEETDLVQNKRQQHLFYTLGARMLPGAPGIATRSKKGKQHLLYRSY